MKNMPVEIVQAVDRDERYLKNYEKQTKIWKREVARSHKKMLRRPKDTLMRRSDAFAEEQVGKSGVLLKENTHYKSINDWYSSLRNDEKSNEKHTNFIQRASGKFPIYVHETCQYKDFNIVKRPMDLEMFEDNNTENSCMRHLKNNKTQLNALERVRSMGNLIIKGKNKFQSEIDYIRRIPENKRFIVKNNDSEEPLIEENQTIDLL
mmetsp:Transcript_7396/g.6555  ORF Transcript_7396/g.6555 Transcript_7396/m.6555 type:complete len:207 (+) Transcript_7396:625-1245(+)